MNRVCGACTACCKLVPVAELGKKAGQKCVHQQFSVGCRIYAKRPASCAAWSCIWLLDPDTGAMHRPDRSHYVIDVMPDTIRLETEDGISQTRTVIQVWVDPSYPDAWKDPALLAYLDREGARTGAGALLRYGNSYAMTLVAPSLTNGQGWVLIQDATINNEVGLYSRLPPHERPPI